jgi:hypothetical protein
MDGADAQMMAVFISTCDLEREHKVSVHYMCSISVYRGVPKDDVATIVNRVGSRTRPKIHRSKSHSGCYRYKHTDSEDGYDR